MNVISITKRLIDTDSIQIREYEDKSIEIKVKIDKTKWNFTQDKKGILLLYPKL